MIRTPALACVLAFMPFLLGPSMSIAQGRQEPLVLSIHSVDDAGFPLVSVAFTLDEGGRPVTEIGPGETRIAESAAPVTDVSVRRAMDASIPLALVVTIDVSGSMAGETLTKAQASAVVLLGGLAPSDRAAVLSFGEAVRIEQGLSANRDALRGAVERLRADGSTALYDGVARSTEVARSSGFTRRAVVLLSDGHESGDASRLGREASLAIAAEAGSPFFVVGVGTEIDREYLERLATSTGGRYFEAAGAAQVPDIYASLQDLLRSQFIVSFHSTSPAELQDRSVSITIRRGDRSATAERSYVSFRETPAALGLEEDTPFQAPSLPPTAPDFPILAVLLVPVGAAVGAAAWALRRKRTAVEPEQTDDLGDFEAQPDPDTARPQPEVRRSTILVVAGPAGPGEKADLLGEPMTVGSGVSCALRLPPDPELAPEHARLWERDGKLMVHHIGSGRATRVAGQSIVWASLDDGDQFEIGPYVLEWHSNENGRRGHRSTNGRTDGDANERETRSASTRRPIGRP